MSNEELGFFLREQCKERGLSLRSLSIKAELGPSTVHGIITRKYQPTLHSLNRLADELGVRRQYLWQLAGLLGDMDYKTEFADPQLRFYFAQVDKLPKPARKLIISLIESAVIFFKEGGLGDKDGSEDLVLILKQEDILAAAKEMGIPQEVITDDVLEWIEERVRSALKGKTEVVMAALGCGTRQCPKC